MASLLTFCSRYWNAKIVLLLLVAASAVSVCWYLTNLSSATDVNRGKLDCPPKAMSFNEEAMDEEFQENFEPVFQNRIVHLDLKGAPPKLEYLAEIFPYFAKLGATGIVMEYEDMFPYWGTLESLASGNAYDSNTVTKINQLAAENKLEVIPLIQTFGHLEFMLKGKEHSHLREVPEQPQAICPSHNETLPVLFKMLEQVTKLHPASKRIHIGADEVYFIGRCSACQQRMNQNLWSNSDLFIDHVSKVAKFVQEKLGKRPMMWDDEFRSFSEPQLLRSGIGALVDVVVWNYQPVHQLSREVWNKYLNVFDSIWAASAFKGATGSDKYLTDVRFHLENHRAWIALVSEYRHTKHYSKFKGIMLTGWQRYDHFAILCELLPVALPSLACDLLLLQYGNRRKVDEEATRLLDCSGSFLTYGDAFHCRFPGSEVMRAVHGYSQIREELNKLLNDSVVRGWLTDYNVAKGFSSPTHLERIANEFTYMQSSLHSFNKECEKALETVYDKYTVSEWLDTRVKPLIDQVNQFVQKVEALRSVNVWPRRPFEP